MVIAHALNVYDAIVEQCWAYIHTPLFLSGIAGITVEFSCDLLAFARANLQRRKQSQPSPGAVGSQSEQHFADHLPKNPQPEREHLINHREVPIEIRGLKSQCFEEEMPEADVSMDMLHLPFLPDKLAAASFLVLDTFL